MAAAAERLDDDERELMAHIDAAATRLSAQVRGLMQVAQVALGATAGRVACPLAVAIKDAIDALRAAAVEARRRDRGPGAAAGRRGAARPSSSLVLQNLIANAIKYRRDGVGRGSRSAAEVGVEALLEVRVADNGVGLSDGGPARASSALFERGDPDAPGTGMGLAVARRMLERHGGTIAARSAGPGQGSEFTLVLPI